MIYLGKMMVLWELTRENCDLPGENDDFMGFNQGKW